MSEENTSPSPERKRIAAPKAPAKVKQMRGPKPNLRPENPGTRYATDGTRYDIDRAEEEEEFRFSASMFLRMRGTPLGNRFLLSAALAALWRVAADQILAAGTGPAELNPWDLVQAFDEAQWRYASKECRTLGEAFGIPDHKGRTATYGPGRVIRGTRTMLREDAIFRDCWERFQDPKRGRPARTRDVVFAQVGSLHEIGPKQVAAIFDRQRASLRDETGRDPAETQ